jgi:hypothetical protein
MPNQSSIWETGGCVGELQQEEIAKIQATRYIRSMIGGTQPQMLHCSDDHDYIVKFQNNPQGARTLANEFLGTLLARYMGLPVAKIAIVEVTRELIDDSQHLKMEYQDHNEQCRAGLCFGSRFVQPRLPASYRSTQISAGCLSSEYVQTVGNIKDFLGMLVFDKWTCNTDNRQVIFIRGEGLLPDRVVMIDLGCCFHGARWDFPDHLLQGVFGERFVYNSIESIDAFDPWMQILENDLDSDVIRSFASQIPPEWYSFDHCALAALVEQLNRRRKIVREILRNCCRAIQHSFRNWKSSLDSSFDKAARCPTKTGGVFDHGIRAVRRVRRIEQPHQQLSMWTKF